MISGVRAAQSSLQFFLLTFSSLLTNTDTFADNADPDEMVRQNQNFYW